ncbi:unnamed protein product [Rotaria sordida]|uniref:Uncharacterized protein n=1 Tax=Rotaria sordida TaxID=392033 RepID=A0A814U7P5_9BILA|nr:unnamed protein product [Rotaria sordida]CAF1423489.1 unnamed protein product [Rotaria sordida]
MVFKDNVDDNNIDINFDPQSLIPLAGALLCDQTTCSILHFLNVVRAKLALRNSKRIRPSFVIIDFSAALLNAVLDAFNTENIHSHLRRCFNVLAGAMDAEQLRNITFSPAKSSINCYDSFDPEILPMKLESRPITKTVKFDDNLKENIDTSSDLKQAESIWSTLLKYSDNRTLFDEKSDKVVNHYSQQAETEDNIFNVLSPKRRHSSISNDSCKATPTLSKRVKTLSSVKSQNLSKHSVHTTKIGSISLPWPPYKIHDTVYMDKKYTTSSSEFRKLFEVDTTKCHIALRKLFKLIDTDG